MKKGDDPGWIGESFQTSSSEDLAHGCILKRIESRGQTQNLFCFVIRGRCLLIRELMPVSRDHRDLTGLFKGQDPEKGIECVDKLQTQTDAPVALPMECGQNANTIVQKASVLSCLGLVVDRQRLDVGR
jgi:hypothetical protein